MEIMSIEKTVEETNKTQQNSPQERYLEWDILYISSFTCKKEDKRQFIFLWCVIEHREV